MAFVAAAIGGSALLWFISSGNAADAQGDAAAASDATQRYMYDTTRADQAPFRDTGVAANNRLAMLLGLSPQSTGGGSFGAPGQSGDLRAQLLSQYTSGGTPAGYGAPSGQIEYGPNGNNQNQVWSNGTPGTVDEAGLQAEIQRRTAQQGQQGQAGSTDPEFGSLSRNFAASDMNADPVYQSGLQFGLNEGAKGINRQAAAGGSFLSGAALKALTRFGNDYGSTKANESYNRFNNNQDRTYNKLAGLSGAGQQATNSIQSAGTNMANNVSANQLQAGNARASGYMGQANAISGGVGSYLNYNQNQNMLNSFAPQASFGGGAGAGFGGFGAAPSSSNYFDYTPFGG